MRRAFDGALRRNSPAIGFLILASLVLILLSTFYFAFSFNQEQFENLPRVKNYDNALSGVTTMDDWSRTKFYISNNLGVAGLYAVTFPLYTGANSVLINCYQIGMALVYNYHLHGPGAMLAFASVIFVHGILEITGIIIVGAASFRFAWSFWGYLGHAVKSGFGKITKKRKSAAKQHIMDYILMVALGSFMILLAAPIESYISPYAGALFLLSPLLALFFLALVLLFYASIIRRSLKPLRGTLASERKDVESFIVGKWRPTHLSLLMLIIFSLMVWLALLT